MKRGIYHLIIKLSRKKEIQIGRLGVFFFPKGFYVYTGSAQVSLEKRVTRHLSHKKRNHWHIDYLLQYGKIVSVFTVDGLKSKECILNNKIAVTLGGRIIADNFGSSDCKCKTHLYFFERIPKIKDIFRGTIRYKREDFTLRGKSCKSEQAVRE